MKVFGGLAVLLLMLLIAGQTNADIITFQLEGKAGGGLLGGNENPGVGGGGSGGIGLAGIVFDTDTNMLSLDLEWGSGNGFTDLSGTATAIHIHGPTANSGTASFTENASVLVNLGSMGGFTGDATNGGYVNTVSLAGNAADLLAGSLYINVHTLTNAGGEVRANLVAVPEPGSMIAIGGFAVAMVVRRRRRS